MGDQSPIEWTDATWNPVSGCSKVSQGCKHCYAERVFPRPYPGRKFTDVRTHPERLDQPMRWRRPRRIFVNSMSDLFHEDLPDTFIERVFAVMGMAKQHTFQVLTKRPQRMWEFMTGQSDDSTEPTRLELIRTRAFMDGYTDSPESIHWPLPNVWLGVSVENQATADERIPLLLETPSAVRFLSCEPLLGPIDLTRHSAHPRVPRAIPLDWVIAGGESGPGARPAHPDWFRSLRDQCTAAGVPFFFKQWGEWKPTRSVDGYWHGPEKNEREFPNSEGISWLADGRVCLRDFTVAEHASRIKRGVADSTRAVEVDELALRAFNDACERGEDIGYEWMYRVGKKRAGRLLDGRTWDEYPA